MFYLAGYLEMYRYFPFVAPLQRLENRNLFTEVFYTIGDYVKGFDMYSAFFPFLDT
jgi:HD superfamily phosphohydrolase YqeK